MGIDAILEEVGMIHEGNYQVIENEDSAMSYNSFPTREDADLFLAIGKFFFNR